LIPSSFRAPARFGRSRGPRGVALVEPRDRPAAGRVDPCRLADHGPAGRGVVGGVATARKRDGRARGERQVAARPSAWTRRVGTRPAPRRKPGPRRARFQSGSTTRSSRGRTTRQRARHEVDSRGPALFRGGRFSSTLSSGPGRTGRGGGWNPYSSPAPRARSSSEVAVFQERQARASILQVRRLVPALSLASSGQAARTRGELRMNPRGASVGGRTCDAVGAPEGERRRAGQLVSFSSSGSPTAGRTGRRRQAGRGREAHFGSPLRPRSVSRRLA